MLEGRGCTSPSPSCSHAPKSSATADPPPVPFLVLLHMGHLCRSSRENPVFQLLQTRVELSAAEKMRVEGQAVAEAVARLREEAQAMCCKLR